MCYYTIPCHGPNIQEVINKASKTLNFVKQTLYQCEPSVKVTAYNTLVRPILEYANIAWDPHQQYLIDDIEMVQRRAARWVKQDYRLTSSVSDMLNDLQWTTLYECRKYCIFINFCIKIHQTSVSQNITYHTPCHILHGYLTICD